MIDPNDNSQSSFQSYSSHHNSLAETVHYEANGSSISLNSFVAHSFHSSDSLPVDTVEPSASSSSDCNTHYNLRQNLKKRKTFDPTNLSPTKNQSTNKKTKKSRGRPKKIVELNTDSSLNNISFVNTTQFQKPIVISNHSFKGGSGKTTVGINFAGAFAHVGLKTIVIDLDPQTNASSYFGNGLEPTESKTVEENFPYSFSKKGEKEDYPEYTLHSNICYSSITEYTTKTDITNTRNERNSNDEEDNDTIYKMMFGEKKCNFLNTLFYHVFFKGLKDEDLAKYLHDNKENNTIFEYKNTDEFGENLAVMYNSPQDYDILTAKLSNDMTIDFTENKYNGYRSYGILAKLISYLHENFHFQVIIIDLGPSPSALNKMAFMTSTHILYTCVPTPCSCQPLRTFLETTAVEWLSAKKKLSSIQLNKNIDISFALPQIDPVLLPIMFNQFTISTNNQIKGIEHNASNLIRSIVEYSHNYHKTNGFSKELKSSLRFLPLKHDNRDHLSILIIPSLVTIRICEEIGRTVVEAKDDHFLDTYSSDNPVKDDKKNFTNDTKMIRSQLCQLVEWIIANHEIN